MSLLSTRTAAGRISPAPAGRRRWARVPLALFLCATILAVVLDVSGTAWTSRLRAAGALTLGPLLTRIGPGHGDATGTGSGAARLDDSVRAKTQSSAAGGQLARLLASPSLADATVLGARVVAVGAQGAAGPQRVTLDVGSRDGVVVDLPVVNSDGLVGRTVAVSTWTTDVLLVGTADLVVGVRVGTAGQLGMVSGQSSEPRVSGDLTLRLVQGGTVAPGDVVTTLGSPSGRPFVAGLSVGTVTSVDDTGSGPTRTADVRPTVDLASLDVVGILLTSPRAVPRATATAGAP